jgi:sugar/nucleoside kinase (ribokinase family)
VSSGRVLIVGDVIDDVVVRPLSEVSPDTDTTSEIRYTAGGSAANQAAWLGSLGVPVRFVGRVGAADVDRHRDDLFAHGVEAILVADALAPTGTIVILLDADGGRTMYTDRGANLNLTAGDVPLSVLSDVELLHVNGYALFARRPREVVLGLISEARARGIAFAVDPCSASFLRDVGAARFAEWTIGAEVCLANLDEGRELTGLSSPADVLAALTAWYSVVALKLGASGVLVGSAGGRPTSLPAISTNVVDATGAGDAFAAGFLCSWLADASPVEAASAGLAAAASAVARTGGRPPVGPIAGPPIG